MSIVTAPNGEAFWRCGRKMLEKIVYTLGQPGRFAWAGDQKKPELVFSVLGEYPYPGEAQGRKFLMTGYVAFPPHKLVNGDWIQPTIKPSLVLRAANKDHGPQVWHGWIKNGKLTERE